MEILVVEDDPAIREIVAADLSCRGYEVVIATNGDEALKCLDARQPAAIVLDLAMPVMDGWSFCRRYQEKVPGPAAQIVVVSAEKPIWQDFEKLGGRRN